MFSGRLARSVTPQSGTMTWMEPLHRLRSVLSWVASHRLASRPRGHLSCALRGGLSRYSRTRRLEAAHAVLVVIAYFEAQEKTDLPV